MCIRDSPTPGAGTSPAFPATDYVAPVILEYVVLLSFPHTAVPSADHFKNCPADPPVGICLFPDVVGCV